MIEKNNEELAYLRSKINSYYHLSHESWDKISKILTLKEIRKSETLEKIGEKTEYFYFICKGLVRSYTITSDGKEITKMFFDKGSFPGNIVSKLNDETNFFTLEALEDVRYFSVNYQKFRNLLMTDFEIARFHIAYIEKNWIRDKENIDVSLRKDNAQARYEDFVKNNPQIYQRVSLGHIATFLGITQTQLSRIRKNK